MGIEMAWELIQRPLGSKQQHTLGLALRCSVPGKGKEGKIPETMELYHGEKSYKQKHLPSLNALRHLALGEPDITEIISNDTHF